MQDVLVPHIFAEHSSVRSGISNRHGGVSAPPLGMNLSYMVGDDPGNVRVNRSRFLGYVGFREANTAFAQQCHSTTVSEVAQPGLHVECDGMITATPGLGLAISIADCVPVLLFDPKTRSVAAFHAGWRGTKGRIVLRGCSLMMEKYRSDPGELLAYIGPAAGPCCYDVGEEVYTQFRNEVRSAEKGRRTVDLKKENLLQLLEQGVRPEHIEVDERCTICHPDVFHSYRRDGDRSGRMLAFIGLKRGA